MVTLNIQRRSQRRMRAARGLGLCGAGVGAAASAFVAAGVGSMVDIVRVVREVVSVWAGKSGIPSTFGALDPLPSVRVCFALETELIQNPESRKDQRIQGIWG